jgi:hypothetical protein
MTPYDIPFGVIMSTIPTTLMIALAWVLGVWVLGVLRYGIDVSNNIIIKAISTDINGQILITLLFISLLVLFSFIHYRFEAFP